MMMVSNTFQYLPSRSSAPLEGEKELDNVFISLQRPLLYNLYFTIILPICSINSITCHLIYEDSQYTFQVKEKLFAPLVFCPYVQINLSLQNNMGLNQPFCSMKFTTSRIIMNCVIKLTPVKWLTTYNFKGESPQTPLSRHFAKAGVLIFPFNRKETSSRPRLSEQSQSTHNITHTTTLGVVCVIFTLCI